MLSASAVSGVVIEVVKFAYEASRASRHHLTLAAKQRRLSPSR
jgi:hypothetical protein